jgi:hypothetical protein
VYVPFFPPDVPVVLRDPAQWQRFARLRDRAETEPDGLARVRQVLAPIEHDLWEAADAAYAAGTEQARATFAADATGALTSGLDKLAV